MSQAQDELVARAADPNAELVTLHELAQNYPGLRPYVAANPRTYPALLDWLGSLGDADVDAVLATRAQRGTGAAMETARRVRSRDTQSTQAITGGLPPVDPEATRAMPTAALGGTGAAGAGVAGGQQPRDQRPGDRTAQPALAGASAARSAPEDTLFGVGTPEREEERRSSTWLWILAAVALVAVVALVVWFLSSSHGGSGASAPETIPGQVTTQEGPAASVPTAQASGSPSETASPTASATPSEALTAPAPDDAVQMSSFTAPSGNITCTLGQDSVSCTIQDHSFVPTDASCDNAAAKPFSVSVGKDSSASGSCGDGYSTSGATLDYGASAKNGDYACTSSQSGIECWSQVSGKGFTLSRTQASTTTH